MTHETKGEHITVSTAGTKFSGLIRWFIPMLSRTAIRVLNFDPQTGDPLGLVFQSAEDTPFILACNASRKPDCEITFIPEMTGVQQSFKVYLSESTYDPMCTDSKIKILNERRKT